MYFCNSFNFHNLASATLYRQFTIYGQISVRAKQFSVDISLMSHENTQKFAVAFDNVSLQILTLSDNGTINVLSDSIPDTLILHAILSSQRDSLHNYHTRDKLIISMIVQIK